MQLERLKEVLSRISGVTFAALDADLEPAPGFRKVVKGEVVLLYHTKGVSGYENMVKRRLVDIGRDPSHFSVGDLPWGERVEGLPLIENHGKFYLQTILVKPGEKTCYLGSGQFEQEVKPGDFPLIFQRETDVLSSAAKQGLPPDRAVICRTYKLESLTELRLMHEKITA
jgi:hypothetical protein